MFVARRRKCAPIWVVLAICLPAVLPAAAGTVGLSWDPSDGATGYKVYYGPSSRNYGPPIDVGNVTSTLLEELPDCVWSYYAVTAYNDAGESGYSVEVSGYPRPNVTLSMPSIAEQGRQLDVTFNGANIEADAVVEFLSSGLQVGAVSVNSCNEIVFSLSVSEAADVGASTVQVTNPSGPQGTMNALFTVEPAVAPAVSGTDPADGANNVAVNVQPTVQFTEPLLGSSVTASTVLLLDSGNTPVAQGGGSPSLSGDGMTATIVPASDLAQGATYRVRVVGGASGVYDLAGHAMGSTLTQSSGFDTVADETAPVISNVLAENLASTTADITWTTNEPADSQVFYRKVGADSYQQTTLDATFVTSHLVSLQGLTPNSDYEFHVSSTDSDSNTTVSGPNLTFTTPDNAFTYIAFEAELGDLALPVSSAQGNGAFGGAWIDTPDNASGSSNSPAGTAGYGVHIPLAGIWRLWVRMYGTDTESDSWFESMNGGTRRPLEATETGAWHWVAGSAYDLSAGLNDLELGGREGGAQADRILLTDDPGFVPTEQPGSDETPPGSVAVFTAVPGDGQIRLEWTNPTDPDFASTVVRYRTDGRFPVSPADGFPVVESGGTPGASVVFTHNALTNGETYSYGAFALDAAGNVSTRATVQSSPVAPLEPPPTPGSITVY